MKPHTVVAEATVVLPQPAHTTAHIVPNAARQLETVLAAQSTTSSFDYWWPYPAWGVGTSTSTVVLLDTVVAPTATVVAAPSLASASVSSVASTTVLSAVNSSAFSRTVDPGLVQITALPPANVSSSTRSQQDSTSRGSSFNIAYLAPLFAVLAALFGAFCAWLLIHWLSRRRERHAHASFFQPGPRYVPPPQMADESRRGLTQDLRSLREDRSSRSGASSDISVPQTGPLNASGTTSRPVYTSHETPMHPSSLSMNVAAQEQDPFLRQPRSTPSSAMHANRFHASLTSPEMFEEEDDDAVPYDTLRHKSIRRGILERLKFGTLRRPAKEDRDISDAEKSLPIPEESPVRRVSHRQGHKRNDSDFNVDEVRLPAMQRSVSSPGPNLLRSPSFGMRDDSPLLHSPGFRIIEEDPEADTSSILERYLSPFIPHRHTVSVHRNPSKDSVRTHSPAADSYTAMPARRSAAEKRSSPYGTPSSSPSKPPASSLARVDSSILPLSPPRIMSPPLESKLFFAAITPDFGSTPSLALHLPATSTNPSGTSISSPAPPKRQQNKLRTKKDPPLLPYPSSSESSPYRNRLKKSFRHGNVTGKTPLSQQLVSASLQSVASPAPSTRAEWCSPDMRFGVRHSALEKVDEILSRSWSQRDVNVDLYVGSATRFGAMVADTLKNDVRDGIPTSASGAGIQQRLEALKTQEQAASDRV